MEQRGRGRDVGTLGSNGSQQVPRDPPERPGRPRTRSALSRLLSRRAAAHGLEMFRPLGVRNTHSRFRPGRGETVLSGSQELPHCQLLVR